MKGHTMKVKLLVARAAASGSENRGDIVEVSDAEAIRMVEQGQAELIREETKERAVKPVRAEKARKG
jgi:hypothetical protein